MFDRYLSLWNLVPDGDPVATPRARLLPVRRQGRAAMLKIATEAEEGFGGLLLRWWEGEGAVRLLEQDGAAILLERALGRRSLSAYAREGRDDEATIILCDAIAALHAPRAKPLPKLVPLPVWFAALEPVANAEGGLLGRAGETARLLLSTPQETGVLHGDIHHDNVLDFEERGWLAIDPKRLWGERGFDYANLFCNPDMEDPSRPVATRPERFRRRLEIVIARSGQDRVRLLQWILAWTGLSAAWIIGDGEDPVVDLQVAALAAAALDD
ncbi:MAG: aminoglycoside phosphotransferase family protein [Dongiaceae bacterium]